uniref:Uncharacterized protein n=1 Tax=Corvus moneduloides TaxID=1196302 RepID=A0A8C3DYB5_CORMO
MPESKITLHPLESAAVGLGGLAESLVFSTTQASWTSVQLCFSCRNSLGKWYLCASDPWVLAGAGWQPGTCSFTEPNGPMLC